MDRVFADATIEDEFHRRGYVVLPFLDGRQIEALTSLHAALASDLPTDFYATVFSRDAAYRAKVSEGIASLLGDRLADLFPHHELAFAVFVTKRPRSTQGRLPLHRDYSFVDPSQRTAVHLWCPLVDVDETNGCLRVVPGSHTLLDCPYAVNEYPPAFTHVMELLDRKLTTRVPMKAGSVLAYEGRLFHGSGENQSDAPRPACVAILIPRGVAPRVYVWNEERPTSFDVLEVTKDFLVRMERGAPIRPPYPEGVTHLTGIDCRVDPLQPRDLRALDPKPRRWWQLFG